MPLLRKYQVFISHAWQYGEDYQRVVEFLQAAPYFDWNNLSVPEHDPVSMKRLEYELHNRMRPADVFLIIAGMYVCHSEWIDFEINFARRIGRPIIGITKWGSEKVPVAISRAATRMVGWNGASIVAAIRDHALATGS